MTGIIDDTFAVSGSAKDRGPDQGRLAASAALLEQAKGVLIFRYAINADTAYSLLELWAAEVGVSVDEVADAVVHQICQGDHAQASNQRTVRWLEERLRHEFPTAPR